MNHHSNSAELPCSAMRIGITPSKIEGETGFLVHRGSKKRVLKFEINRTISGQNPQTKSETQLNNLHYVKLGGIQAPKLKAASAAAVVRLNLERGNTLDSI